MTTHRDDTGAYGSVAARAQYGTVWWWPRQSRARSVVVFIQFQDSAAAAQAGTCSCLIVSQYCAVRVTPVCGAETADHTDPWGLGVLCVKQHEKYWPGRRGPAAQNYVQMI